MSLMLIEILNDIVFTSFFDLYMHDVECVSDIQGNAVKCEASHMLSSGQHVGL